MGEKITDALKNSVMYKLSYYRFWEVYTVKTKGYDKARKTKIGHIGYDLKYFEEVYTSVRWMVRIFKVKKISSRKKLNFTP